MMMYKTKKMGAEGCRMNASIKTLGLLCLEVEFM